MKEIIIDHDNDGCRMDKFLKRYFKEIGTSFLYKMLRKKNIKLNEKKASGSEILCENDRIQVYFSDETFEKFRGNAEKINFPTLNLELIYEDENIAIINKEKGMLCQKAVESDTTLVEYFLGYLQSKGEWSPDMPVKPSICNRLDRNTSGVVLAGKSIKGLQNLSELLRERKIKKYYYTIVEGKLEKEIFLDGFLVKDKKTNTVKIVSEKKLNEKLTQNKEGNCSLDYTKARRILTYIEPIESADKSACCTLLKVDLITGKTHQIRAHLASIGHPIIGDVKYGAKKIPGIDSYLLHAKTVTFPKLTNDLKNLSERTFFAPCPKEFVDMMKKLGFEKSI